MQAYSTRAYAKINLTLDITGKRFDGYHTISSVMQSVDLYDTVTVSLLDYDATSVIVCDDPTVPCDIRNTAYKAAKLIQQVGGTDRKYRIDIKKNIPSQAGLGGASTDAAAVLRCFNTLLKLSYPDEELMNLASDIGADVPFGLFETTALCQGIGDVINALPALKKHHVVIVKPEFGVSTPEAYKLYDTKGIAPRNSTKKVVKALYESKEFYQDMSNDFEELIDNKEIYAIKAKLMSCKALCAQMSGSGSAVFALFKDESDAEFAYKTLSKEYKCYLTTTR